MRTCALTQKTKMNVFPCTNLSLFFCSFHFRTLNRQSTNTSKKLHNSQRLQDGTTLFLKLRKQQYILKFLTNHSRFGALIIITLLYNFLRVKIRIDDFTSPKTLTELESFIAHNSLAGLGFCFSLGTSSKSTIFSSHRVQR